MTQKPWANARTIVPPDWKRRRAAVLRRDQGICHVCRKPGANQVDHIVNVQAGGTHALSNLAAIHREPCHREKTQRDALAGRQTARRPPEKHPGLA